MILLALGTILLTFVLISLLWEVKDWANYSGSKVQGPWFINWLLRYFVNTYINGEVASTSEATILYYFKRFGNTWTIRTAGKQLLFTSKPNIAKHVLNTTHADLYQKPSDESGVLFDVIGAGIMMSEGPRWSVLRSVASTAISTVMHTQTYQFGNRVCKETAQFCEDLRQAIQSKSAPDVVIHPLISKLCFLIMARSTFGWEGDCDSYAHDFDYLLTEMQRPIRRYFPLYRLLPVKQNKEVKKSITRLRSMVHQIVKNSQGVDEPRHMADAMVKAATDKSIEPHELEDNIMTFLLAGHETTAAALCFALYLLAAHHDIQERVREEIRTVTGGGPLEGKHSSQLKLLRGVILESLRLYPPAPILARTCTQLDTLPENIVLQSGSVVLVCLYAMHRNPTLWPNPDMFLPDRFLDSTVDMSLMLPFSSGRRRCVGESIAMTEEILILATMLLRFDIHPSSVLKLEQRATLRPQAGFKMRFNC